MPPDPELAALARRLKLALLRARSEWLRGDGRDGSPFPAVPARVLLRGGGPGDLSGSDSGSDSDSDAFLRKAKLFRSDRETGAWEECGFGPLRCERIDGKTRVTLHDVGTLRLRANFWVAPWMRFRTHASSRRSVVFSAAVMGAGEGEEVAAYALRFALPKDADEFREVVDAGESSSSSSEEEEESSEESSEESEEEEEEEEDDDDEDDGDGGDKDIPGVPFKVVKVSGVSLLDLYREKKET